jgi:uncharacterized phage-like protein YoqJ
MKTAAATFTGHRPFKLPWGFEEDHPDCIRLKLMLSYEIEDLISRGCTSFLSGMCWGVDIWCAEMVLNMRHAFPEKGIRLKTVLPFEAHHAGWTKEYQERYFDILEQADESVTLYPSFAEGCYQRRNRYMVDRSRYLIAVFNGKPGGTANTVEYAKQKGLEIVMFDPERLSREHITRQRYFVALK